MDVPPLVTTSPAGTSRADAGVLGRDGTEILVGNEDILEDSRAGVRFTLGSLIVPNSVLGFEADYLGLEETTWQFLASSNTLGSPILARPFFNMNPTDDETGEPDPPRGRTPNWWPFQAWSPVPSP